MKKMRFIIIAVAILCVLAITLGCNKDTMQPSKESGSDLVNSMPDSTDDTEQTQNSTGTEKIMRTFLFGSVQAEVGHDAEYNIYVNFEPDDRDKRIFIKQSNEGGCEWLGDLSETERVTPMMTIYDSITGDEYYLLCFRCLIDSSYSVFNTKIYIENRDSKR